MRLTTYTDYTIRVLIHLSLQRQELVTIADIARAYNISQNHLMKVVHQLAVNGYVETVRGKGGGMRLAREPKDINLGELTRITEGNHGLLECVDSESNCCIQRTCALIGILREAHAALYAVLDRHTLADLIKPQPELSKILLHPRDSAKTEKPNILLN